MKAGLGMGRNSGIFCSFDVSLIQHKIHFTLEKLTIQRSFLRFYFPVLIIMPVVLIWGGYQFYLSLDMVALGMAQTLDYLILILSIGLMVFSLLFIFRYFSIVPSIQLHPDKIRLGRNREIGIREIDRLELIANLKWPYMIFGRRLGTAIRLKDGSTIQLYDDSYRNLRDLKLYLQQVFVEKRPFQPIDLESPPESQPSESEFEFFKGSFLKSKERGIVLLIFVMFVIAVFHYQMEGVFFISVLFFLIPLLFLYAMSHRLYYFGIHPQVLLVKNFIHNRRKIPYLLHNIRKVVFYRRDKNSGLIVVTKDFRTHHYIANTLANEDWANLEKSLKRNQIPFRHMTEEVK